MRNAEQVCTSEEVRRRGLRGLRARRPRRQRDRRPAEPHPRADEGEQPAFRRQPHARRSTSRPSRSRRAHAACRRHLARRRTSSGRSAASSARILCPDSPDDCELIDTGGYKVITTLDWKMQRKHREVGLRGGARPERQERGRDARSSSASKIPASDYALDPRLRGKRHQQRGRRGDGLPDRRRSWPTRAAPATRPRASKRFQPQFDVLADGWRQPGSSIKPINYAIGIDDKTVTAATMFMDVVTNFGNKFTPTQADKLERGPVRLRSALQFSLNIPAIKADADQRPRPHLRARRRTSGSTTSRTAVPGRCRWASARSRSTRSTCSRRYGTIANGGVLMPRTTLLKVLDDDGPAGLAAARRRRPKGERVISRQAAYIITDILAGQHRHEDQPVLGQVGGLRRQDPPAGRLQDRHDERQPRRRMPTATSPRRRTRRHRRSSVGVWMGNSNNQPNAATCRSTPSAPLWSRDHAATSARTCRSPSSRRPPGLEKADGRRLHRLEARAVHDEDRRGALHQGHRADEEGDFRGRARRSTRRRACSGRTAASDRRVTRGFFDLSEVEANFPTWQKANRNWAARAAIGAGVRGGPEGTRTSLLLRRAVRAVRSDVGRAVRPDETVPARPGRHAAADRAMR